MRNIVIAKTEMAEGTVVDAWHAIWVILVGVGWASSVLNFILELHFLRIDFQLAPYSAFTALSLVAVTFCFGAMLGAIFAMVWNWLTVADEAKFKRDLDPRSVTTT
jgi:hypothetical protein